MGIFKSRHQQVAGTVNFLIPYNAWFFRTLEKCVHIVSVTHIKYFLIPNPYFPFKYRLVLFHSQNSRMIKPNFHLYPLFQFRKSPSSTPFLFSFVKAFRPLRVRKPFGYCPDTCCFPVPQVSFQYPFSLQSPQEKQRLLSNWQQAQLL